MITSNATPHDCVHATCFAVRHSRRSRKARVRSSIADKVRARRPPPGPPRETGNGWTPSDNRLSVTSPIPANVRLELHGFRTLERSHDPALPQLRIATTQFAELLGC